MAYVISPNEIKKTLTGYTPEAAEDFQTESAKQADHLYGQALKTRAESTVILMSGGSASGKSEYVSAYLVDEPAIVFDGTLPTLHGAEVKIARAKKAHKTVAIHAILPENFLVAFVAFLNRDRKFPVEHFYRTHSSARHTLLELARTMPDIAIKIFMSKVDFVGKGSTMSFRELTFSKHQDLVEFLEGNLYTEEEIAKKMAENHDI